MKTYNRSAELQKIKEMDMPFFLSQMGLKSTREFGLKVWYRSPFSEDANASMCVFLDKNRFKCFSTGKGGSIIDFTMAFFSIPYEEAIKLLREKYYNKA